jgi:thioredoxin
LSAYYSIEQNLTLFVITNDFTKILKNNFKMAEHLTKETFIEKIFDFEKEKEWKYKGNKPAIIDFYADWCQPCKMVAPIIEELSVEYKDKVDVYKINTEDQQELSAVFGVRSIPSLLFIPVDGQPQMSAGALPKDGFVNAFEDIFGIKK